MNENDFFKGLIARYRVGTFEFEEQEPIVRDHILYTCFLGD